MIYFIFNDEWITTGIKIHADFWDAKQSCIKKSHPKYYQVNTLFSLYKSRAELCVINTKATNVIVNKNYFETFVFNEPQAATNPSFCKLIDDYCNNIQLGWQRILHYQVLKKNIQELNSSPRLQDITYNFALKLQQHLRLIKNNDNTISRKMRQLKAVVHYAQKEGYINADPLINIKIKSITGTKHYLTAAELQTLETLYTQGSLPGIHQSVLKYFLFSCYTGLRYSDIIALKYYDIKNNCVCTTQEKTDKPVMIPLINKARELLNIGTTGLCFKTHCNQVSNRKLKDIMQVAGIDKEITFHCSRHTFGTLSIYWGIPKAVVADLMGIDNKTVDVYAKIIDDVKQREMLKWEQKAV